VNPLNRFDLIKESSWNHWKDMGMVCIKIENEELSAIIGILLFLFGVYIVQ